MDTNLELRKKELMSWMSKINDEKILIHLEQIKQESLDWCDSIGIDEKSAIDEGVSQLNNDEFITQSEMRSGIKQKYGF